MRTQFTLIILMLNYASVVARSADFHDIVMLMHSNMDSFEFINCKYEITFANARTYNDAKSMKWSNNPEIGKGHWLRKGGKSIIRFVEDAATTERLREFQLSQMPGKPGIKIGPGYPFKSFQQLTNHDTAMIYDARNALSQLFSRKKRSDESLARETPFVSLNYGSGESIHELSEAVLRGEIVCEVTNIVYDQRPCICASLIYSSRTQRYIFDPSKGYMPVFIEWKWKDNDPSHMQMEITSREYKNKRWFPTQIVYTEQSKPDLCKVYICKVVELDVDTRIDDGEFVIDLPSGTMVDYPGVPSGVFRMKQPERITPDNLAHMIEICESRPADPDKKVLVDTTIIVPSIWTRYQLSLIVAIFGILLLLLGWFVRRRRHVAA